ncbi:hypothetical protein EVAR_103103_1 [Eumeta japonica]|uniref:Uncharacterized protein n=1 Tax=Eumeta variegata TaxID=151549 RepID=A0A4C1WMP4_EUMVA|nr:hypothetical protein EVAR_103103_1 [Eumeta japonica]
MVTASAIYICLHNISIIIANIKRFGLLENFNNDIGGLDSVRSGQGAVGGRRGRAVRRVGCRDLVTRGVRTAASESLSQGRKCGVGRKYLGTI